MKRVLDQDTIASQLAVTRQRTEELCKPLEIEDYGVQPMDDASPPKWHLAHTTWFFETFILRPAVAGYTEFDPAYEYLFNSYYNGVGERHPRPQRGLLSRPLVSQVLAYRDQVNTSLRKLLDNPVDQSLLTRIELGIHHEQQHQELILTDLKYNFGHNPLLPVYKAPSLDEAASAPKALSYQSFAGGQCEIGVCPGSGFHFDNELPQHPVWLQPFEIANRLITNGEFLDFIEDDGYEEPSLWLSDGWTERNQRQWHAPEYWFQREGQWFEYTLHGAEPLQPELPVCHISYYEADAFARWMKCRLPTEFEWEHAALSTDKEGTNTPIKEGTFADLGHYHPRIQDNMLIGDCWQWTSSSYSPYPGYHPLQGTLGEYNGKFMANQYVLRGGSCATPRGHFRPSYRNFFYSKDRWQFTGIRLVKNIDS